MPALDDPNFFRSVTLVCQHDQDGAMGLVVNLPSDFSLGEMLAQMQLPTIDLVLASQDVLAGGPVQTDRGFVLHTNDKTFQATVQLEGLSLSTSQDVLFAIADGTGPEKSLITLGYAGWEAGQLEAELADNAWLNCPFDPEIIFDRASDLRLEAAAASLGINLHLLTSQAGHA